MIEFFKENTWALIMAALALTLVLTVFTSFVWNIMEITGCAARRMKAEERRDRVGYNRGYNTFD